MVDTDKQLDSRMEALNSRVDSSIYKINTDHDDVNILYTER